MLSVGLRGEQPEHPALARDRTVGPDGLHPDVVHLRAPVDARGAVRLRDDQQVAAFDAHAQLRIDRREPDALRVRGALLLGEDPQPRLRDDTQRPCVALPHELVLAVAEEDVVVREQPFEERDGLVDLVLAVARRSLARAFDHPPDPRLHLSEVTDRAPDVAEHATETLREPLELIRLQMPLELEVHYRLARLRLDRFADTGDAALVIALDADDRMEHEPDRMTLLGDLLRERIDEERRVLGVLLDDRADRRVAVARKGRVERPDSDGIGAAGVGELEDAHHLPEQLLRGQAGGDLSREPARVHTGERADDLCPVGGQVVGDAFEQLPEKPLLPKCKAADHAHDRDASSLRSVHPSSAREASGAGPLDPAHAFRRLTLAASSPPYKPW